MMQKLHIIFTIISRRKKASLLLACVKKLLLAPAIFVAEVAFMAKKWLLIQCISKNLWIIKKFIFLGLFLSRAPARDKNKPRKVENSSIKLISQAQKFFIQIRFQLRYRKVYILQMKRKSAKHFWGNPRINLLAISISIINLSHWEHVQL